MAANDYICILWKKIVEKISLDAETATEELLPLFSRPVLLEFILSGLEGQWCFYFDCVQLLYC